MFISLSVYWIHMQILPERPANVASTARALEPASINRKQKLVGLRGEELKMTLCLKKRVNIDCSAFDFTNLRNHTLLN